MKTNYAEGVSAGEELIQHAWEDSMQKVLPAWIKCTPEAVAEYIQHLQGEIEHRRGPKR